MTSTTLIQGSALAKSIRTAVSAEVERSRSAGITPRLAAVLATPDPSARAYAQTKQRSAAKLGIQMDIVSLEATTQQALNATIGELSANPTVHGILIELPLAPGLDIHSALDQLDPGKDVDGLTPHNLGLILSKRETDAILPATPQACIELAETWLPLAGKRVALVGRGQTVGRPLGAMLVNRDATVTICHTRTPDLAQALSGCDIVMVAIGKARQIGGAELAEGQVVIDAGINVVGESVVGDVDAASVTGKVAALTPVPGGVGPVTTAIIFRNLIDAIRKQGIAMGTAR